MEIDGRGWTTGGLAVLLVFFVGVALLFTGRYPTGLHRLLVGIARWSYRVAVYVFLLRDEYPPFRLDQGAEEPGADLPPPVPPVVSSPARHADDAGVDEPR